MLPKIQLNNLVCTVKRKSDGKMVYAFLFPLSGNINSSTLEKCLDKMKSDDEFIVEVHESESGNAKKGDPRVKVKATVGVVISIDRKITMRRNMRMKAFRGFFQPVLDALSEAAREIAKEEPAAGGTTVEVEVRVTKRKSAKKAAAKKGAKK